MPTDPPPVRPVDRTGLALAVALLAIAAVDLYLALTRSAWYIVPWTALTALGAVVVGRLFKGER